MTPEERPSAEAVQRASALRVVLVHQSVGRDLLLGLQESGLAPPLRIVDLASASDAVGAGVFHARLGLNRQPETKLAAFEELMRTPVAARADAASVKLCYADIHGETDVDRVFEQYRAALRSVQAGAPSTRVFAWTVPLTTIESGALALARRLVGAPAVRREANARRSLFNRLVREAFGEPGRLFDIAGIESGSRGGHRSAFAPGEERVESLDPRLSSDGGHLNERGRRIAASEFVRFLSGRDFPADARNGIGA
jgi:hypothetical protein